jgi:hypothetical protein
MMAFGAVTRNGASLPGGAGVGITIGPDQSDISI